MSVRTGWQHHTSGTPAARWRLDAGYAAGEPLTLEGYTRVVVLVAHPDDESLGAAGAVHRARRCGLEVELVCVTDGEGSHPESPTTPPVELARRRRAELRAAAEALGVPRERVSLLGVPDGHVAAHVGEVVRHVVDLVGDGRDTLVVATWAHDGHPDHEAVGRAAAAVARRTGADLWEFPVWFWHWADPTHPAWPSLQPLALDAGDVEAKRRAVSVHATQVAPLSGRRGDEALLSSAFLEHFAGPVEHYLATASHRCADDALDELHRETEDPWGVQSRWYERRKRDLVLATLPRERFRRALEVGCSTGALAEALRGRSDAVVALDRSPMALQRARERFAGHTSVRVQMADVPAEWPVEGAFDLVVVSEVGYFLSPAALEGLVSRVRASLGDSGVLVLCHWRHLVEGWVLDARAVHAEFEHVGLPAQAVYQDRDVEIRVHAASADWPDPRR